MIAAHSSQLPRYLHFHFKTRECQESWVNKKMLSVYQYAFYIQVISLLMFNYACSCLTMHHRLYSTAAPMVHGSIEQLFATGPVCTSLQPCGHHPNVPHLQRCMNTVLTLHHFLQACSKMQPALLHGQWTVQNQHHLCPSALTNLTSRLVTISLRQSFCSAVR